MSVNDDEIGKSKNGRIKVAIVGGGCAALTTAFELTRPEHQGRYDVTVYQLGWRLGGKGASGRGPSHRIEEHGLHIWLGFYENAFRLIRECYDELDRDPDHCPITQWTDAFKGDSCVGLAERSSNGGWLQWTTVFPPADKGLPGDPLTPGKNPFTVDGYIRLTLRLVRTLLQRVNTSKPAAHPGTALPGPGGERPPAGSIAALGLALLRFGVLGASAGITLLQSRFDRLLALLPDFVGKDELAGFQREITRGLRDAVHSDDETRYIWQIIDLVMAILTGLMLDSRFRKDPDSGFDAINDDECCKWLMKYGASEESANSAFVRGLYDLAMAYPGGDKHEPDLAAGQAIRGALRMFFTYRGELFWKMQAGMGDIVFAPLFEVLRNRNVKFRFFHRLEDVVLAEDEPGRIKALKFDIQARIRAAQLDETGKEPEYEPLIDVDGLPCWPSQPDYSQLEDGERIRAEGRDFESFWDRRRCEGSDSRNDDGQLVLEADRDFDFAVLGIGIGAVPYVCEDLVRTNSDWRNMVEHVRTVPTQAFQIWMREDMEQLGWQQPPVTLSGFAKPFDTWADMSHLISRESWHGEVRSIAYFCGVLDDSAEFDRDDPAYPQRRAQEVRENATRFLNEEIKYLWPGAVGPDGTFQWDLLVAPGQANAESGPREEGEPVFDSQFHTANVNPSDRYVLAPAGSIRYRIQPHDTGYSNLMIAGDWTACGFTEGCVEAAVMSGRLAAHGISGKPAKSDIIGYDYP